MTTLENSHRRQESDARAKARTADFELTGKLALWRKTVAGMDLTAANEGPNVFDDLHGELAVASDLVVKLFDLFFHAE
jgi:hypothetical protein